MDLALVKWSRLTGGVLLARLIPRLRTLNPWLLAAITAVLAAKPLLDALDDDRH